jgi:cytochrome c-type biogenesis protein CcmH
MRLKKGSMGIVAGVLALGMLVSEPLIVYAQTPQPVSDDDVNRIASQLYCPVCENVSLDACPSDACILWRGTIRSKLEAGWTDEEIINYFVDQFGARVVGLPPRAGFNWLLYGLPPIAAAGLAAVGVIFVRNQRKRSMIHPQPDSEKGPRDEALRQKVQQDFDREESDL